MFYVKSKFVSNVLSMTVTENTIMDIIFEDFLILYQNFFSLQVKRSVIISNKHGLYELSNDLRLRILGN